MYIWIEPETGRALIKVEPYSFIYPQEQLDPWFENEAAAEVFLQSFGYEKDPDPNCPHWSLSHELERRFSRLTYDDYQEGWEDTDTWLWHNYALDMWVLCQGQGHRNTPDKPWDGRLTWNGVYRSWEWSKKSVKEMREEWKKRGNEY